MGWKIDWLEIARDDLREIVEFIAGDNPDKAIEVGSMLIDKIEDLESFPDRGSKYTEYNYPDLYHLPVSHYRIIYHLTFDLEVVEIWRIWHGARGDICLHPPQS